MITLILTKQPPQPVARNLKLGIKPAKCEGNFFVSKRFKLMFLPYLKMLSVQQGHAWMDVSTLYMNSSNT
jgi:hypothetical protein